MKIKLCLQRTGLFLATAVLFTGCASANYNKAAGTAAALNQSATLVTTGSVQMDRTLAALNDLLANPQPDLRMQFKTFDDSVNDLAAAAQDVAAKTQDMQTQGDAYFTEWDLELAQIHNEDIRTRSESRKAETMAKFAKMHQQYDDTEAAFKPFMSDLHDIQKFLANDLTPAGLAAIKDPAAKATSDAEPLKKSLTSLSAEFDDLGLSLSPNTPAK